MRARDRAAWSVGSVHGQDSSIDVLTFDCAGATLIKSCRKTLRDEKCWGRLCFRVMTGASMMRPDPAGRKIRVRTMRRLLPQIFHVHGFAPARSSSRHLPLSAPGTSAGDHLPRFPRPCEAVRRLPSQTSTCAPGHRPPATRSCGSCAVASPVRVNACTQGPAWCDVTYRGSRGWVSARYLDFGAPHPFPHPRDHRPPVRAAFLVWVIGTPVITFQFGTGRYLR